jgi:hypothetical protein
MLKETLGSKTEKLQVDRKNCTRRSFIFSLTKYYDRKQTMEDETGGSCKYRGGGGMHTGFMCGGMQARD